MPKATLRSPAALEIFAKYRSEEQIFTLPLQASSARVDFISLPLIPEKENNKKHW